MFKLEIKTDDAAFGDTDCETFQEIAAMLISLRRKMQAEAAADIGGCRVNKWIEAIRDTNGNIIGTFTYDSTDH